MILYNNYHKYYNSKLHKILNNINNRLYNKKKVK